jgi:hypothetical protein
VLIEGGRVVEDGPASAVVQRYLKSLETIAAVPLAARKDRGGDGALRFESLTVRNASVGGGLVRSGDDVDVELVYRSAAPTLRNVHVDIVIHGPFDEQLAQLSNTAQRGVFEQVPGTGVFHCRIPRFPFESGAYRITVYSEVDGDVADWVTHAATLDVEPGDFFGTGRTNFEGQGRFLIPHEWTAP